MHSLRTYKEVRLLPLHRRLHVFDLCKPEYQRKIDRRARDSEGRSLTFHIRHIHDRVLVLDVFDDPPDEPLRALRRGVHGDESEGLVGHRRGVMRGCGCVRRGPDAAFIEDAAGKSFSREGAHMIQLGKVV